MAAQAHWCLRVVTAYLLANDRVFEEEAEDHEIEMGVRRRSGRKVSVLQEIRCEREIACYWLLFAFVAGDSDKVEAEELVGMRKVIRG